MEDDLSFLEPNFDLTKLTKPQLRGLISVHSPDQLPPTSAKKDELIKVIQDHILPHSKQIMSARKKIKPSSAGITFLDSQSRPSPSRTSSVSPQDSAKKRNSRSKSPSPRRSPTKARGARKEEEGEVIQPKTPEKSEPYSPLSSLKSLFPSYQDTPKTATQKLSARFAEISEQSSVKSSSKAKQVVVAEKSGFNWQWVKEIVLVGICVLLTVSTALFVRWKYIHPFPYCPADNNSEPPRPLTDIIFSPTDAFVILDEYCLPCPRHARCVNGRLQCLDGFIKRSNWGFGAQCVPDRKQLELVDKVGKMIMKILSDTSGEAICQGLPSNMQLMSETDLKAAVQAKIGAIGKFEHIFKLSVDDLLKEGSDLRVRRSQEVDGERLFESMKPKLPIGCRLRLSAIYFINQHKQTILTILIIIVTIVLLRLKYRQYKFAKSRIEELVGNVFQLLAEQAAIHRRDPLTPSTVIVDQLRDALFLKNHSDAYLWPRVCSAVTANSNVREQAIQHHGQYLTSWEWIGMDIAGMATTGRPSPPRPVHTTITQPQQTAAPKRSSGGLYPSLNF